MGRVIWIKRKEKRVGIGVVIKDEEGKVIVGISMKVSRKTSLETKAEALRERVHLDERSGMKKIVLEIDSEIMYKEIMGRQTQGRRKMYPYVHDIHMRKTSFEGFQCSWVRRANQAADCIVNQVKKGMSCSNWVILPPSSFVHILSRDGLPAPP